MNSGYKRAIRLLRLMAEQGISVEDFKKQNNLSDDELTCLKAEIVSKYPELAWAFLAKKKNK